MPTKSAGKEAGVGSKGIIHQRMAAKWPMVDALKSTQGMRDAGQEFLPKEPKEPTSKYNKRLQRSWLYGAYWNTVKELASAPLRSALVLKDENKLPKRLQGLSSNIDKRGRTLTQFARQLLRTSIDRGLSHILPDMPKMRAGLTKAQEEASGVRPYFTHVAPDDLFGWRLAEGPDGCERVVSFKVHEDGIDTDPATGEEKEVEWIRVYNLAYEDMVKARGLAHLEHFRKDGEVRDLAGTPKGLPGTVEVYRYRDGAESGEDPWELVDVRRYTYVGFPLATHYTNREGLLEGSPALQELAEKNVEHWQSSSDQKNLLRFARVPILVRTGATEEEKEAGIDIGAGRSVDSSNPEMKLYTVEHNGAAMEAGRKDIQDTEEQMEVLKLKARQRRTGDVKATQTKISEQRGQSDLEAWALDVAAVVRTGYEVMAGFLGDTIPDTFEVQVVARNLTLDPNADKKIENLIKMREKREISSETFLSEVKRLDGLDESLNVDEELERLSQEQEASAALVAGFSNVTNGDGEGEEITEEADASGEA